MQKRRIMGEFNSKEVEDVFNSYPGNINKKMMFLRQIVLETADEIDSVKSIEETEGNRAIVFNIKGKIPINELKHCFSLSLTYHKIKHLPMLGA